MVHIIAYLIISYAMLILVAWYVIEHRTLRPVTFRVLAVAILLIMPLLPYGIVDLQTILYRQHLAAAVKQAMCNPMLCDFDITNLRVIRKWPRRAVVYVIVSGRGESSECAGFTLELVRVDGQWRPSENWDVIWADGGNAHGNVFPPYPSQGDYH